MNKEKRDNHLAVPLLFRSINHLKMDFSPSGVSDVLMDETEERGSQIPVGAIATQKNNNEQNHYYPFGLKHSVYASNSLKDYKEDPSGPGMPILTNVLTTEYLYKYNGFIATSN